MRLMLALILTVLLTALAANVDWAGLINSRERTAGRRIRIARGKRRRRMLQTRMLIEVSNIRMFLPFYNSAIHLMLSAGCAAGAFFVFSSKAGMLALFCVPIGFLVPSLALQLMADLMEVRLKKYYVNFLITFSQFHNHVSNLFEAFRLSQPYLIEPLRGYVDRMIYEYDMGIAPEKCLRRLRGRVHNPEIKTFFRGLEIVYRRGGDVGLLIEKTIAMMEKINLADGKAEAEEVMLRVGMYGVLAGNFALLNYMMGGSYWQQVAHSAWGITAFMVNVLCAAYVVRMIMQQGNWKEVEESFERLE